MINIVYDTNSVVNKYPVTLIDKEITYLMIVFHDVSSLGHGHLAADTVFFTAICVRAL